MEKDKVAANDEVLDQLWNLTPMATYTEFMLEGRKILAARPSVPQQGQAQTWSAIKAILKKWNPNTPQCADDNCQNCQSMREEIYAALAASRSEEATGQPELEQCDDFAIERFLNRDFDVSMADTDYPAEWPEELSEKPVARIRWFEDKGDPSVGIQGWSGFTLLPDQSGTWLEEKLCGAPAAGSTERVRILEGVIRNFEGYQKMGRVVLIDTINTALNALAGTDTDVAKGE